MRWIVLALALWVTSALAQPVSPNSLPGTESWPCGTGALGGPGVFCTTQLMRSSTTTTGTVTGALTLTNPSNGLIITAQPSAAVITLPAAPVDGQVARFCNGTTAAFATNAVTVVPNTGQTSVPAATALTLTTLAANTCQAVQYAVGTNTWYRIQ